jgi:hypothetical protein
MEDIQTCIVPDDLFREVRPPYPGVGKVESVDDIESLPYRKPYRRFSRQHRSRRGAQSGE